MQSLWSMGKAVQDPWERVRERVTGSGDEDLRALLRDADEMRRFIEHVRWASTWYGWALHGDAIQVLARLGRPAAPEDADHVAAERREPMRVEEQLS